MSGPIYKLSGVSLSYPGGDRPALSVDRLELFPNEVYAVVGPNGSGKSTLFSLLALLVRPSTGRMEVFGRAPWPNGRSGKRGRRALQVARRIGLVSHHAYLFRGTVAANLAYGLRVRGVSGGDRRAAISRALDLVDLADYAGRRVSALSAGQAQRVALARVLIFEPEVVLLDEATANLDTRSQAVFEEIVGRLHQSSVTVLMSTHQREMAERMGTRTIRLEDGRIVEQ